MVVVLAAALGLTLKAATIDPKLQAAATNIRNDPAGVVWPLAQAMIEALVFFNVFEFTNLADKVKMALSWRSALLIGVACGLVSDRVISAFQAFLK